MTAGQTIGSRPIRRAQESDLEAVGHTMAAAFAGDPVSNWLVRDDAEDNARIMPSYLGMLAGLALQNGWVYVLPAVVDNAAAPAERFDAVAVWMDATAPEPPPPPAPDEATVALCGQHADRFHALDLALHQAHDGLEPHHHLWFLAVRPELHGQGMGSVLLAEHHRLLDDDGMAGYLDASSPRSRELYLRRGYRDIREPFVLPDDGPPSFPMWRPPGG